MGSKGKLHNDKSINPQESIHQSTLLYLLLHLSSSHLFYGLPGAFYGLPGAQMVKNLPAVQKTWVRSLGSEDPLEKRKATHSSVLTWRIP